MNTQESSYNLNFRPDIQGLRALAIFLVVFCHAGLPGFAGGFVGVDIFFVLSGYLISGLLIKEVHLSDKVNFLRFYSRRLKRLLPALLTVVFTTSLTAYFILAPFEQIEQAQTAFSVSIWLSNFYFSFADLNYFAPVADSNLFLHTWSLAVEEQFYLVWPLLLFILLLKVQHASSQDQSRNLLHGLIGIFLLSFALSIYWLDKAPVLAFYLMPSRAWQFALGGITFVISSGKKSYLSDTRLLNLASLIGIGLVVATLFVIDDASPYPGIKALLPSLATALILISGLSNKPAIYTKLFSWRWMQKIGDLSYSWYLWHWPVLVLGNIVFPQTTFVLQFSLLLLSLVLAQLSYVFIETPLRNLELFILKPVITLSASITAMLIALLMGNTWGDTAEKNLITPDQLDYTGVRNSLPVIYRNGCDDWYSNSRIIPCNFGDAEADKTAILIGDSVGAQWFTALADSFTESGWRFIIFTKSSCPIVDEPIFYDRIGMVYEVCEEWRDNVLAGINQFNPDLIFIGNSAEYDYTQTQWNEGTQRVLSRLAPGLDHLFIIPGTHNLPFDGPGCLARQNWQPEFLEEFTNCTYQPETYASSDMLAGISIAASSFENVSLLDLNPIVCPNGICSAKVNDEIVYRDSQHLTDQFVSNHQEEIEQMIRSIYPF